MIRDYCLDVSIKGIWSLMIVTYRHVKSVVVVIVAQLLTYCLRQPRQLHSDDKFGHQQGEINFWMPLTSCKSTRTRDQKNRKVGCCWYKVFVVTFDAKRSRTTTLLKHVFVFLLVCLPFWQFYGMQMGQPT